MPFPYTFPNIFDVDLPNGYYSLEVDWDGDGVITLPGDALDVYAFNVESRTGRDFPSQLTGRSSPGQLVSNLNNRDGRFNSFLETSPLFGSILPGRFARLRSIDITEGTMWTGFLDGIESEPSENNAHVAMLRATGPLGLINQRESRTVMGTSLTTGTAIENALDDLGWGAGSRTIDAGQTTMDRFWSEKVQGLTALQLIEDTEAGFITESSEGNIVFEDRHHRLKGDHLISQGTITDDPNGTVVYSQIRQLDPLPNIYNEFPVQATTFPEGGSAVLWVSPKGSADSSSPQIAPGESIDVWPTYPTPDAPTNAVGVGTWNDPIASSDYFGHSAADGTGDDLTATLTMSASLKAGQSMKVVYGNPEGGTVPIFLTKSQAVGTPITASDPEKAAPFDAASQLKYGERTFPHPGKFIPTIAEGRDWANFNLSIYKDPLPILEVDFAADRNATAHAQAINRKVSDRITVVGTNRSDLGINEDFFIEAITYNILPGRVLWCTWQLSPATGFGGFWVLGIGVTGTSTKAGY